MPQLRRNFISVFKKTVAYTTDRHFHAFLRRMHDELRRRIAAGDFRHQPLSKRYQAWKKRKNLKPNTLQATDQYRDAIQIYERVDPLTGQKVKVLGLPVRRSHESENYSGKIREVDYHELAHWLEFGTKEMPPRPHWRPMSSTARREFQQTANQIAHELGSEAKKVFRGLGTKHVRVR